MKRKAAKSQSLQGLSEKQHLIDFYFYNVYTLKASFIYVPAAQP